jgi:uncharacterized membrane protein
MDDVTIARGLHVLAVVLWIGGVGFVTTVLLPAVGRVADPKNRLTLFEQAERRFAWQARATTLIAGLSGFYMAWRLDLWDRFRLPAYWWMHAMVLVWLVFTLMLFVLEPLVLDRRWAERARTEPESTFRLIQRLHWTLLTISLITVLGAVLGAHGVLLFD